MANSPQAKKRAKQAEKRRLNNIAQRSNMRTHIKKVLKAVASGILADAQAAYKVAVPIIDSMVNKKHVNHNFAARIKSRLNTRLKKLAA
ncbi:MAG: 30S ribosomal protein S20 [Pseudomonadota bacterium]|nr:30S ribosomal protein S20 [Pseudomonadota bacterium]